MFKVFSRCAILVICSVAVSGIGASNPASPTQEPTLGPRTKSPIPPVGDYKEYALSKDASSYDQDNPANDGLMVSRVLETGDGWVKLGAGSSQTDRKSVV